MPLTQTRLRFPAVSLLSDPSAVPPMSSQRSQFSRSSTSSSDTLPCVPDPDTIVVGGPSDIRQLPTPSESAADATSQSGELIGLMEVPQGHGRRVTPARGNTQISQNCSLHNAEDPRSRSVSGSTLVASTSQSSLLQHGIAALNIPWSINSSMEGSQERLMVPTNDARGLESVEVVDEEAEIQKTARAAAKKAKKAKIEENAQLREAKRLSAEEKATRRSSRVPLLEKAGEIVSSLAASVLGKRPRDPSDRGRDTLEDEKNRASLRSTNTLDSPASTSPALAGRSMKKRKLAEAEVTRFALPDEVIVTRNTHLGRKEKRWLKSGLYTGQTRHFDGRLTESKNKRRQDTIEAPPVKENRILPLPMFAGERLLNQGRDFKLPFEIFSPLPPGQPKPDEWRKTNKNVFIGDAAQFWRISKFQEHSTCMCKPETGCDNDCMNRFMFYECDERNCNLAEDQCGNRSFEGLRQRAKQGGKYNVGVEVIKTADRGYGVRSNRTFDPNQIIVEYTGEIITQDECESRMRKLYKDNECYYLMLFDQNMIIDATRGSIARFVNHSCEPNCRMEKWTVGGKPRMALFAGEKGILTGDELTYDYNFDPFSQRNVQECRCGSKKCRGVLGPKAKDEKKSKSEQETGLESTGTLAGAKRKIANVLDESTNRLNKKRKLLGPKSNAGSSFKGSAKPLKAPSGSRKLVKARVHMSSRTRTSKDSPRATLIKGSISVSEKSSPSKAVSKKTSTLKRIVETARSRAIPRRVISNSSATEALIPRSTGKLPSRKESVKARAETVRRNMVNTVKGVCAGKERTIRPIVHDEEE